MPLSGVAVAEMAVGGVLLYSGIKGYTLAATFTSLVKGTTPAQTEQINTQSAASSSALSAYESGSAAASPAAVASAGAYSATGSASAQQALNNAAAPYGWNAGPQWQALVNIEMREAGFNPAATNPSSGAYGLGQALGHGQGAATQGTVTNQYGGYGVSDSVAQQANSGLASAQAIWMCAYIRTVYGTPVAAWAHEQAYGWY